MNNGYKAQLERVRFSEAGKESLVKMLGAEEEKITPKPRRVLRVGLVAAVVAGLFTLVAGAAFLAIPVLRGYYSGPGYAQSAGSLGHSVSQGGWTMTLTDCIGDDNYLYLGMSLTGPQGAVLNAGQGKEFYLEQYKFLFDGKAQQAMAWGLQQVPDADTGDNRLQFVLWIEAHSGTASLNGRNMELTLGKLYHFGEWNEQKLDFEKIYDSEEVWNFGEVAIDYPDNTIRLAPNAPVTVLNGNATVATVEITPIGVTVQIRGDALRGHHREFGSGYCIALPQIDLYDREGRLLIPDKSAAPFGVRGGSGCSGGSSKKEEGMLRIVQSYGYLLDLEALDRIEVCGVSFPLH